MPPSQEEHSEESQPPNHAPQHTEISSASDTPPVQAVPEHSVPPFPIVGIGASAGGLEAFEKFFTHIASDTGIAFVIVKHLDPNYDSMLVDIIQRYTRMNVVQVEDGIQVEPNTIYIIPPNRNMSLLHRTLYLTEPEVARGLRLPIDFFFRSLADELHEHAICIILSGTGTDGTLGMRAIKGEGGMAMVQTSSSAKYDGMPLNAISTGMVDYTLPPEDMPHQLITYVHQEFVPGKRRAEPTLVPSSDKLQKVFLALRSQTGHDFSQYKPTTIMRRIERRMTVNQILQIDDYVRYLRQNPVEVDTLFREMLIGVTSFFRDAEAFDALKHKMLPRLFEDHAQQHPVRVWVPGCSTGEEAFSLAILLKEKINQIRRDYIIQIFATDIDNLAIEKARAGIYPGSIAADVSPERLHQFFSREGNNFHVAQSVREMVIFAVQNVIKDPPFSAIDLISCRNLLIYLNSDMQKRVLPLFHYALKQDGFLFLGTSETPGESTRLFATIDRKWSLFQRINDDDDNTNILPGGFILQEHSRPLWGDAPVQMPKRSLREMAEQKLLEQYAPPGVIINSQGEILYFHGKTGKYLEPASGDATLNVFQMAREGLHMVLPTAIREANRLQKITIRTGIQVKTNGDIQVMNVRVIPLPDNLLLINFEDVTILETNPLDDSEADLASEQDQGINALQQELKSTREYLQTTIEELQSSNEEVKSSDEELQSTNEELQSTNEELVTSKEELQSVNEELVTVNTELRTKVEQLSRANNDQKNLLASMDVGTIFLDQELHILRFTPTAGQVLNVLESDIGRPLHHLTSTVITVDLVEIAEGVLHDLQVCEQEVQNQQGDWFILRAQPYRTTENVVEGVVMTFSNITHQKKVQLQLHQQLIQGFYYEIGVPIFVLDVRDDGNFYSQDVNPAFERLTGYRRDMVIGKRNEDFDPPLNPEHIEEARAYYRQCVKRGETITYEQRMDVMNQKHWWSVQLTPLKDTQGQVYRIIGTAQPIAQKQLHVALQQFDELMTQIPRLHKTLRHHKDETSLATAFCHLLVQIKGYQLIRVGLGEPDQPVPPITQWTEQRVAHVPTMADMALDDGVSNQLAESVLHTSDVVIIADIASDPMYAPWHAASQACDFSAVMVVPLVWQEQQLGVIVVAATSHNVLDSATTCILHHLIEALAYGLAVRRNMM